MDQKLYILILMLILQIIKCYTPLKIPFLAMKKRHFLFSNLPMSWSHDSTKKHSDLIKMHNNKWKIAAWTSNEAALQVQFLFFNTSGNTRMNTEFRQQFISVCCLQICSQTATATVRNKVRLKDVSKPLLLLPQPPPYNHNKILEPTQLNLHQLLDCYNTHI